MMTKIEKRKELEELELKLKAMILNRIHNKHEYLEEKGVNTMLEDMNYIKIANEAGLEEIMRIKNGAKEHNKASKKDV